MGVGQNVKPTFRVRAGNHILANSTSYFSYLLLIDDNVYRIMVIAQSDNINTILLALFVFFFYLLLYYFYYDSDYFRAFIIMLLL